MYVNGTLAESMAAAARYAGGILGREVFLWEIQRVLEGKKRIRGLEVIRADEPLPRRKKKAKRKLSAGARRRLAEAGRKSRGRKGKRLNDIAKAMMSQAKVGEKNPMAKLTEEQVLDILVGLEEGEKLFTLSRRYKVSEALISRIKHGRRWSYLNEANL